MLLLASKILAAPLSIGIERPSPQAIALGYTQWTFYLEGEIDAQAATRVQEALARAGDNGAWVYLNSPGGNLLAGMEIGRLIRAAGGTTYIGKRIPGTKDVEPGWCYSACSLAFLGGTYRYQKQGSKYGVHRFSSTSAPTNSDLDVGQILSSAITTYIREMGVDLGLFDLMAKTAKDELYVLTPDQERALLVVNNGRQNASWIIEVIDGVQYLRGMQDTVHGMGKIILTCLDNKLALHSIYQAGNERANEIINGSWVNSLQINENDISPLPKPEYLANRDGYLNSVFRLTSTQINKIYTANSVGHIMQFNREAPLFVGFRIDVNQAASRYVRGYIDSCLRQANNGALNGKPNPASSGQQQAQVSTVFLNADLNSMIAAAYNKDTKEVERVFGKFKLRANPQRGDRALARKLNAEGLAAFKKEDYASAASLFRQGGEADAGDAELINNYAYSLQRQGNYMDSIPALEKTLFIAIDRPSAWFNLYDALATVNMQASACGALTLGLKFVKVPEQSIAFLQDQIQKESDSSVAIRKAAILECAKVNYLAQ